MGKDRTHGVQYISKRLDNHKLSLGAAEEVTYHIKEDGEDSASSPYDIYFNFERESIKVVINATVACSLTEVNGKTLKSPRTINPGANVLELGIETFKIVSTGSTVLEATVK